MFEKNIKIHYCFVLAVISVFLLTGSLFAVEYNEAPELAAKVEEGELPPVEDRLPKEPFVREVHGEIGNYGGSLNTTGFTDGPYQGHPGFRHSDLLISRDMVDDFRYYPHVAKDLEKNEDASVWTIHLREGMRWSDGEPFTAEDILFWWEDIILNEKLESPGSHFRVKGKLAEVTQIDDYTIEFSFVDSNPMFYQWLGRHGGSMTRCPKHYLKQFHPTYQDEETLQDILEERGFDEWFELFEEEAEFYPQTIGRPTLEPWILTSNPTMGPHEWERNPYYWAVDPEGNQLPYIDKINIDLIENTEVLNMRIAMGETDFNYTKDLKIMPLVKEAEAEGKLNSMLIPGDRSAGAEISFNQTYEDPVLREIFQDRRWRIAISHAIDREEVADLVYMGLVEPTQAAPIKGSPYYHEEFAKAYIEYDPEKANSLLDEMGLDERDNDGYRLRPDGERLEITLNTGNRSHVPEDLMELLVDYIEDLGIKVHLNIQSSENFAQQRQTGEWQAMVTHTMRAHSLLVHLGAAAHWVPSGASPDDPYPPYWASDWARWIASDGEVGEEPPEIIKKLDEYYQKQEMATTEEERAEYMRKILDIGMENLWVIGIVSDTGAIVVTGPNVENVTEIVAWLGWRAFEAEQWYISE